MRNVRGDVIQMMHMCVYHHKSGNVSKKKGTCLLLPMSIVRTVIIMLETSGTVSNIALKVILLSHREEDGQAEGNYTFPKLTVRQHQQKVASYCHKVSTATITFLLPANWSFFKACQEKKRFLSCRLKH